MCRLSEDSISPSKSNPSRSVYESIASVECSDVSSVSILVLWKPVFDGFDRVLLAGQATEEGSQWQAAGLAQASAYALIDIYYIVLSGLEVPHSRILAAGAFTR